MFMLETEQYKQFIYIDSGDKNIIKNLEQELLNVEFINFKL